MVTEINWVPPPHSKKAKDAMEVVVVGIITAAQPQQEEHTPTAGMVENKQIRTQMEGKLREFF